MSLPPTSPTPGPNISSIHSPLPAKSPNDVEDLRQLIAAQAEMLASQQNTLAAVLKRLEEAEGLLLQMSAKVFPK